MSILRSRVPPPRSLARPPGKLAVVAAVRQQVFAEAPAIWGNSPRSSRSTWSMRSWPRPMVYGGGCLGRVGGLGHQREQPRHRLVRDPGADPGRLGLLSLPQARSDDPPNAVPGRRLDPLLLQVRKQLGPYPVDLALLLTHVSGQPRRNAPPPRPGLLPAPGGPGRPVREPCQVKLRAGAGSCSCGSPEPR
jgi:hypothetical protein